MTLLSYHASHEQFEPAELVRYAQAAELAGFDGVFCSDHLQPWSPSQGQSGFAWSWLGAALQATRRVSFGTITVPGGWRYQPVVLAQAIATLGQMFPDRLPWVGDILGCRVPPSAAMWACRSRAPGAVGSGEALNERLTGLDWPSKTERNERLQAATLGMRALLEGETVTLDGPPGLSDARIWSRPRRPTRLVGAATSIETARWLGGWADGLLTIAADMDKLASLVDAFREGGGAGKPVHVKLDISWARTEAEALEQAHANWRFNALPAADLAELRQPEDFMRAAAERSPEDMRSSVLVSADLSVHRDRLHAIERLGVESIDIHQVGLNQLEFLDAFGEHVLPFVSAADT